MYDTPEKNMVLRQKPNKDLTQFLHFMAANFFHIVKYVKTSQTYLGHFS